MGNGHADANGDGGGMRGGKEVNGDVQGAASGLVRDALRRFTLDVMFGTDQIG
jgi:hypothetical protein